MASYEPAQRSGLQSTASPAVTVHLCKSSLDHQHPVLFVVSCSCVDWDPHACIGTTRVSTLHSTRLGAQGSVLRAHREILIHEACGPIPIIEETHSNYTNICTTEQFVNDAVRYLCCALSNLRRCNLTFLRLPRSSPPAPAQPRSSCEPSDQTDSSMCAR